MKVNLDRAKAGAVLDLAEAIWQAHAAGVPWDQATSAAVADKIVTRYSAKIAAALRGHGFAIAEGETIDGARLLELINQRTGLDIADWTPDAVRLALDAYMARRLSDVLGVDVASVADVDTLKQSLIDAAADAVATGRGNAFVSAGMVRKIQAARAWSAGGIAAADRRATLARWYQKKFRRSHKGVWL